MTEIVENRNTNWDLPQIPCCQRSNIVTIWEQRKFLKRQRQKGSVIFITESYNQSIWCSVICHLSIPWQSVPHPPSHRSSKMLKVVLRQGPPRPPHLCFELLESCSWSLLQELLEVAKDVFNGLEIWTGWRQEDWLHLFVSQKPLCVFSCVHPSPVVQDGQVAPLQRLQRTLLDSLRVPPRVHLDTRGEKMDEALASSGETTESHQFLPSLPLLPRVPAVTHFIPMYTSDWPGITPGSSFGASHKSSTCGGLGGEHDLVHEHHILPEPPRLPQHGLAPSHPQDLLLLSQVGLFGSHSCRTTEVVDHDPPDGAGREMSKSPLQTHLDLEGCQERVLL